MNLCRSIKHTMSDPYRSNLFHAYLGRWKSDQAVFVQERTFLFWTYLMQLLTFFLFFLILCPEPPT